MKSSETRSCSSCGTPIPTAASDNFCPACLMSGAIADSDADTILLSSSKAIPSAPREPLDYPREFGSYRLMGLLGRGGMATVHEAEHIVSGRRVALKMLAQQLDSAEMRRRFLREGRLAASVNHPNSLYVFGAEEIEGVPVITMEIAAGGTLKDKLGKRGPLPVTEAVDAILDVIAGLEAAHARGVLHRDVKPSNCFIGPDSSVKVGDYGLSVSTLAKDDSYATATGAIMGTPAYASLEQLRGDELDVRADIYSVGATLFTLLTNRAPFGGENAVQVVANVVNQIPTPVNEFRDDVPPGLVQVIDLCLAKEPDWRYTDYTALRNALLPFSSLEPEPASLKIRAAAGWIDYLLAFMVPYVVLMFTIGQENFHFRFLFDRTLYSARYYATFLAIGFLYFALAEGIWGGGVGKRLKGLRVIRRGGRPPGFVRGLIRILVPIAGCELVRIPLLLATLTATVIDNMTTFEVVIFTTATSLCPIIPVLFVIGARRGNGFAAVWDRLSGSRVVIKPVGSVRTPLELGTRPDPHDGNGEWLGPYQVGRDLIAGEWLEATDPVLRRQVWLLRRTAAELSPARQHLARSGRLRWLQKIERSDSVWDVFEATDGVPYGSLIADGKPIPWGTLRHWLHDLASELWSATGDRTLPAELSLDSIWITSEGRAILLDRPWPEVAVPAQRIPAAEVTDQQRFLAAMAASVDATTLPLHARPLLKNLARGKFEKPSFLAGTLRGLLDKPAEVSRGIRLGAVFMIPTYTWIMVFVGLYTGEGNGVWFDSLRWNLLGSTWLVLGFSALLHLLEAPFGFSAGHSVFRLAVVDHRGRPAGRLNLLTRWALVWLPLLVPMAVWIVLFKRAEELVFISTLVTVVIWGVTAGWVARDPHRGVHDRLARTWVVRR